MADMGRGQEDLGRGGTAVAGMNAACAVSVLLFAMTGCWESSGIGPGGGGDADADSGVDEETDSLTGVACSDLSPCIQSVSSGFSCPGAASGVKCWNLGSQCDAAYLCASSGQACEIGCAATTCAESAAIPPQPLCY
jgi:hypothetical protein